MKLFTKADNAKLFANYSKGSDMANQNVVVKIFNPYGRGTWFIMNSDPNDPDYLWGIVDLGQGVEVGSISRSNLENYRNRFGWRFERDTSFSPKNAREVFKGLQNGEFFKKGGRLLSPKQRYIAELKGLTGLQQKAIEDYIEENNLTSDEILHIVIGLGRKQISRSDVSTAIVGTKNNSESKKLLAFAMSDSALKAEYGAFMDGVYAGGGGVKRKMDLSDSVIYQDKVWYITEKNGVVGLMNFKQGAWGSNYPFIPLSKISQSEITDMMGREVEIPYLVKDFDKGGAFMGGVSDKYDTTKKPDANGLYYIVYSENGKKVPSSELPTNIGYGKIKNEFLARRKRYDNSLGLQDAVTIVMKMNDKKSYSLGGKTTFAEKSSAIAKNFVGKSVEPKYQKEYGKRYDAKEAKEVGNKIVGKQKATYDKKNMKRGGSTKQASRMTLLTQKAKEIRKEGEAWRDALKRANAMMK